MIFESFDFFPTVCLVGRPEVCFVGSVAVVAVVAKTRTFLVMLIIVSPSLTS